MDLIYEDYLSYQIKNLRRYSSSYKFELLNKSLLNSVDYIPPKLLKNNFGGDLIRSVGSYRLNNIDYGYSDIRIKNNLDSYDYDLIIHDDVFESCKSIFKYSSFYDIVNYKIIFNDLSFTNYFNVTFDYYLEKGPICPQYYMKPVEYLSKGIVDNLSNLIKLDSFNCNSLENLELLKLTNFKYIDVYIDVFRLKMFKNRDFKLKNNIYNILINSNLLNIFNRFIDNNFDNNYISLFELDLFNVIKDDLIYNIIQNRSLRYNVSNDIFLKIYHYIVEKISNISLKTNEMVSLYNISLYYKDNDQFINTMKFVFSKFTDLLIENTTEYDFTNEDISNIIGSINISKEDNKKFSLLFLSIIKSNLKYSSYVFANKLLNMFVNSKEYETFIREEIYLNLILLLKKEVPMIEYEILDNIDNISTAIRYMILRMIYDKLNDVVVIYSEIIDKIDTSNFKINDFVFDNLLTDFENLKNNLLFIKEYKEDVNNFIISTAVCSIFDYFIDNFRFVRKYEIL
jgi:hypothetical protein